MVGAIVQEIAQRAPKWAGQLVETVYFGGGTPSVLTGDQVKLLLDTVRKNLDISGSPEITLEANPDDLQTSYLRELMEAGINRLSIGIQSFHDEELAALNRSHTSGQADASVKRSQDVGIENLTIDLMYALPQATHEKWLASLTRALSLDVPHISAYCLTIEEGTAFGNWTRKGKMAAIPDEFMASQYDLLCETLGTAGYQHYELSNFAKTGSESRHNSAYWKGLSYLGVGPSAHSYDGERRRWNVRNNQVYMQAVNAGLSYSEEETLTERNRVNEYLITRIRTAEGIGKEWVESRSGVGFWEARGELIERWQQMGWIRRNDAYFALSERGMLMADSITTELMCEQ